MRTEYQRLTNDLHAAINTGNREYADEAFSQALAAEGVSIDSAQFEELADDYYNAISAGEI